jgi:uncharacterized protein
MLHLQRVPSFPSAAATRHFLYQTLVVLWVALCMLAAGGAMAAPARAGQTDVPSDAAQAATPSNTAQIATPTDAVRVQVPPYSARVLDTTGTLNTAQVASLNEQILAIEADTRAAVVVFMLPTTGEDAIEEYATRVFEKWKLGDTQRDDGILILVALDDRRMRIEVGQGLEGIVPDVLAGRIIDQDMKPRFQRNNYAGGLEAAISHIGALLRGDIEPPDASPGGITPFGWAFFAALLWGFAVGVVRAHRTWKWPVTIGIVSAGPAVAVVVLKNVAIGAILLSFPVPLAFALGFGCGRSRTVRMVTGGIALALGVMVGIAFVVGSERFGVGLLYALGGGIGCLLLGLIAMGMRAAYKRSLVEFAVRSALVACVVGYVAFQNSPDLLLTDWESWLPTGMAFGLAMLFGFFTGGAGSSSGRDDRDGSSSSGSSSSSSSRSSSGGSSSGGGSSGSW